MALDRTWFNALRRRFQALQIACALTGPTPTAVGGGWREHMPAPAVREWWVLIGRRREGLFQRPAALQSLMQRRGRDADSPRPVMDHHALTVEFQPAVSTRVSHLRRTQGPSDIAGLVASVVVDAVKRVLATGWWANVAQEDLKRISPLRTDRNAACAVPPIGHMIGVGATGFHREPILVFTSGAHPMCARWHGAILSSKSGDPSWR